VLSAALAAVASFDVGVNGDEGDADDGQEQGDAENQSTVHSGASTINSEQ